MMKLSACMPPREVQRTQDPGHSITRREHEWGAGRAPVSAETEEGWGALSDGRLWKAQLCTQLPFLLPQAAVSPDPLPPDLITLTLGLHRDAPGC